MRTIDRIILHCSASSNPGVTAAEIRSWHLARGFNDIGYHFFIRTNGALENGRPMEQVGAHCEGYNNSSIGICLNGLNPIDFRDCQFAALENLLTTIHPLFPLATIHPHSELSHQGKSCPVYGVYRFQDHWRSLTSLPRLG